MSLSLYRQIIDRPFAMSILTLCRRNVGRPKVFRAKDAEVKPLLRPFTSTFSGLYYKQVTIVIYDRNDSGQYYKTTIAIVIYDPSLS